MFGGLDFQGLLSAKGTSMAAQTDITERFRSILVDWLVEVHLKFRLNPETLYLTVSIVDRFLEKKIITRNNLQLVGIAGALGDAAAALSDTQLSHAFASGLLAPPVCRGPSLRSYYARDKV